MKRILLISAGLLVALSPAFAETLAMRPVSIIGTIIGNEPGEYNVSGLACAPNNVPTSPRNCVVVDDELMSAQSLQVAKDATGAVSITTGPAIGLIDKDLKNGIGRRPVFADTACAEEGKTNEFDGEAVAFATHGGKSYYYLAGSHGCGRNKARFKASAFVLARLPASENGEVIGKDGQAVAAADLPALRPEFSHRLAEVLRRATTVGSHFGKLLDATGRGLNVEGLAVIDEVAYVGLRGPVLGGKAFIVIAGINDVFRSPSELPVIASRTIELGLDGFGIRDLAALPGNRLLVLAGPELGEAGRYRLYIYDIGSGVTKTIGDVPEVRSFDRKKIGKAEVVMVLDPGDAASARGLQAVVMFDGLPNGAPLAIESGQ